MRRAFWFVILVLSILPMARAEAAVTAGIVGNVLEIDGDAAPNRITVRVAAGDPTHLEVYDEPTLIGSFVRGTFTTIQIHGNAGSDIIVVSHLNGPVTEAAAIHGDAGDDSIRGSSTTIDTIFGGPDNDNFNWSPGEGGDVFEGDTGHDVVNVIGTDDAETYAVEPNLTLLRITRNPGNVILNLGTIEELHLEARDGNDIITCTGDLASLNIPMLLAGEEGNDDITGSNATDVLSGGEGQDTLRAQGADTADAGSGDDLIIWSGPAGIGGATGNTGTDKLTYIGNASNETITLEAFANLNRITIVRNLGGIVHASAMETIEVQGGDGFDTLTALNDLGVVGLVTLILDGGALNDNLTGSATNDILRGGVGTDTLNGGGGNDTIVPGPDDDVVNGGPGDDTVIWNVGDGADTVQGDAGSDRLQFTGDNSDEQFGVFVLAADVIVRRGVASAQVSLQTTEAIELAGLGGSDELALGTNLANLVTITADLGSGADLLRATATSTVIADGSTEFDTLEFDAGNQPVSTTPSTIAVGGVTRVTHTNFEQIQFTNVPSAMPPTVTIATPTSNPSMMATTPFVSLTGSAADDTPLASVTWASSRGPSGYAMGTTNWSVANVPVYGGINDITVTTTDAAGNGAADVLRVTVNAFSYTMAEGATGGFFDTDILIANPNSATAPVTITYLKGDASTIVQTLDLAPMSRTTITLDTIAGLENAEVSATVTSTAALPLAVERTMRWDATGYGAHTERATDAPATTWYFAEGSQGFFDTYVLLANPQPVASEATVQFLREGGTPVLRTYQLPATSRTTIHAGSVPEIVNTSFGIVVTFSVPGVAERAMYFGTPVFNAGHESAGVNAPSTSWFLAEGATGTFFTTFVLLANPGTADAAATITFLPAFGAPVVRTHVVPAGRRVTLNIAAEDATLSDAAVATQVQSTQPILVERAQYWPGPPAQWYEAHNSFGGTALGTTWGLAEGRVGGAEGYQTYILLANADATQAANVAITYLRTNGTTVVKTYTVPASSRFNVHVNRMVPELADESFGAIVDVTSGPGIFVERALYRDAQGVVFAAGTNALATRLPPPALHP